MIKDIVYEIFMFKYSFPFIQTTLFHSDGLCLDVGRNHIPHLVFDYVITTHQFFPSNYFIKDIPKNRQSIRNKVRELFNQGWGYTKIHHHLIKNGFKIGKSRTTVDSIIKKIKKRQDFINQSIYESGFQDFRVEVFES